MTIVIHQSSKWYLDSWPPQNTLVLPCFGMFLLRFQPVVKTNIKTWHIKTQLKPKNWSTDEGGDHDQHDETQEENQDIGSAAGEVRLGPHCINRQRHLRTATVEECVAGGEVYQDATSMVNSYGYGSKFEAYGTTHVSICLVLTIWLLDYQFLTHAHIMTIVGQIQFLTDIIWAYLSRVQNPYRLMIRSGILYYPSYVGNSKRSKNPIGKSL